MPSPHLQSAGGGAVYHRLVAGLLISLLLLLSFEQPGRAASVPHVPANRHGLSVVTELPAYRTLARNDHDSYLVDLRRFVPGLRQDLPYAREDNVAGHRLYDVARAYATVAAAERLRAAQRELAARGLGLKIWDGYRPYSATLSLWDAVHDRRFAAPPASGSLHNRGCALDLTLVRPDGGELDMPTPYDVFGARASHSYQDLPQVVLKRRALLRAVMEDHGFRGLATEWWHYHRLAFGSPLALDIPIGRLGAVPLPVDVWLRHPLSARLLVLVERWQWLARRG